jgi:signal transduction histidine kinase
VIAALELDRRVERAARALAYLACNVPIAIVGALAVIALALGAALSVAGIGLPLLLGAAATCRHLVRLDRRAANRFLDLHIPPVPGPLPSPGGGPWRRSLAILSDRGLWRIVALLATKPLVIAGLVAVGLVPAVLLAVALILGIQGVGGVGDVDYLGPWSLSPELGIVLLVLALPAAVLLVATFDALYVVLCTIGRAMLAPRSAASGPVREMLAESLGDRSVAIAYWLPDRDTFVDEAAIIHDAALDTSSELVQAAASASSLAIDNERLKADLRARVAELRVSRQRIVEAADEARRRIERDLHDGAQQQLLALALELRVLRSRVDGSDARELVDGLAHRLDVALGELRELARGIHPALLTQSGLGPAISSLAERSPAPVHADVAVDERLPAPIESAAYFVVAEALTNVAKYAQASRADVVVRRDGDELLVLVTDDGVGGVEVAAGSGLRGLQDRLAAVDGRLRIDSEPGAGTRLEARIPWPA